MAENNNAKTVEKKPYHNYVIAGVIVLVAIALIIFVRSKPTSPSEEPEETVSEENSNDNALHVGQQVVAGDYTYEFQGIKWIFDTESPEVAGTGQTWLKMEFADFTRNGSSISFGRPYKLGFHAGTCKESDFIDTSSEEGIPLGYVVCEGAGIKREFVALQKLENVTIKMRETKGDVLTGWQDWYKINVTEIVR